MYVYRHPYLAIPERNGRPFQATRLEEQHGLSNQAIVVDRFEPTGWRVVSVRAIWSVSQKGEADSQHAEQTKQLPVLLTRS